MTNLLGDEKYSFDAFEDVEKIFNQLQSPSFKNLSSVKQFRQVCETLATLIRLYKTPCFLLPACVLFIRRLNKEQVFIEPFHFNYFEFWLIHFSDYSEDEIYLIRSKIAGKHIPREDYQGLFPIGMGKVYQGTHFVTAHLTPDADTMIASFWGWLDAFAAKVSNGLNIWALPGGPPDSPSSGYFKEIFCAEVFAILSRSSKMLTLMAMDLLTQTNFIQKRGHISVNSLDHGLNEKAVILVDDEGCFVGDWRSSDAELVRQVIILYKACLNWFENNLHLEMVSLFARSDLSKKDINPFLKAVFSIKIKDCKPVLEFSEQQKNYLQLFLEKVLTTPKGIDSTFKELFEVLIDLSIPEIANFKKELLSLENSPLFNEDGSLAENRPLIFEYLKKIIFHLNHAIQLMRDYVERLDICLDIKQQVLQKPPHFLTLRNDVEDIRLKMKPYDYLTVVLPDNKGKFHPLGLIWARDLRNNTLGTVSLRDFSDLKESKMASYLSVISLIDHHKTNIQTFSPPLAIIGDVQSCNVLVLECSFEMSDRYSTGGMLQDQIETDLKNISQELEPSNIRLRQRLLNKKMACSRSSDNGYFIHEDRERIEYLSCLYAILDDTDLLNKVSNRDVECVAQILNRLKSIQQKQEIEIVQLDHIPKDANFAKEAAKYLLHNEDMHSLYKKIYIIKEQEINEHFKQGTPDALMTFLQDVKEQNGCCRISQTKLFPSNFSEYAQQANNLRSLWIQTCKSTHANKPEIDLYIHMISTIPSAEDIFHPDNSQHSHQDEIWFWVPTTELALSHLAIFLSGFKNLQEINRDRSTVIVEGLNADNLLSVFQQNFPIFEAFKKDLAKSESVAILQFSAGLINSRKAMISPFLPSLMS